MASVIFISKWRNRHCRCWTSCRIGLFICFIWFSKST